MRGRRRVAHRSCYSTYSHGSCCNTVKPWVHAVRWSIVDHDASWGGPLPPHSLQHVGREGCKFASPIHAYNVSSRCSTPSGPQGRPPWRIAPGEKKAREGESRGGKKAHSKRASRGGVKSAKCVPYFRDKEGQFQLAFSRKRAFKSKNMPVSGEKKGRATRYRNCIFIQVYQGARKHC